MTLNIPHNAPTEPGLRMAGAAGITLDGSLLDAARAGGRAGSAQPPTQPE